jgi:single-strand DNA-binding protein
MEKIIIMGNLGQDPDLRFTKNGDPVVNLSVAVNKGYMDKNNNWVKQTTWWRASAWGRTAESLAKSFSKGRKILLEGTVNADEKGNPRVFQRNDGSWGSSYELKIDKWHFCDSNNGSGNGNGNGAMNNANVDWASEIEF